MVECKKAYVAGHVPAQWDGASLPDQDGCAERILEAMNRLQGDSRIDFVITFGDEEWREVVDRMVDNLQPTQCLKIWKEVEGGGDLRVDGQAQKISVYATRTRQLVYECTYDSVQQQPHIALYKLPVLFKIAENLKTHFKEEPFKGVEDITFHSSCPAGKRQEITDTFKLLFKQHAKCTEFWAPMHSTLEGDLIFKFADAEKVSFHIVAELLHAKGRYQVKELTMKPGQQFYAEQHGSSMQFARR